MLATATGSVGAGYAAAITVGAAFQTPAATAPSIGSGGIANAVGGGGSGRVDQHLWNGAGGDDATLAGADLVDNAMPTSLEGVNVQINGKPAYIQYVKATQVTYFRRRMPAGAR